jgi:hypothetical protein
MKSLVQNAADPTQVKEAEKKDKLERDLQIDDMKFILSTPQGRRLVWRYLEFCGIFRSIWHPSAEIHFNEGMRNVGLRLITDIEEANPDALVLMMKEAKEGDQKHVRAKR